MILFKIYIFTVAFAIFQFAIESLRKFYKVKILKVKSNIDIEEFKKEAKESNIIPEKVMNFAIFVSKYELLDRTVLFILCFIPIANVIFALIEISEIFELKETSKN